MLSRPELCGNKRDWLADDDAEDAGHALRPRHAEGERGQFTVVRAVDEELLDIGHGVAEIRDERSSSILPLSSSASVRRHSRSAVPTTSSASSPTKERSS